MGSYKDRAEQEIGTLRCSVVVLRAMMQHARQAGDAQMAGRLERLANAVEQALEES